MSRLRAFFDIASSAIVALLAIVLVGMYTFDRFARNRGPVMLGPPIEDWQAKNEAGYRLGPSKARMEITVFQDFTCPYCRDVASVLDSLRWEYPADVAIIFQHYPLRSGVSTEAAVAAECAAIQGAFWNMYRVLYSQLDSIGSREWKDFATDADLPDPDEFLQCLQLPVDSFTTILAGRELGKQAGVTGTPTVWVNGGRFRGRSLADFRQTAATLVRN